MAVSGDVIKRSISDNITKYRELSGLSQKEFAKRLGVTPSRVSNWEQGLNCPTIDMLLTVCSVLDVSINDIYGVYPDSNMILAHSEVKHIHGYRSLSATGKAHVDAVLQWELDHAAELAAARSSHADPVDIDVDAETEDYRRRLELEKKAKGKSDVSNAG